MREVRGRLRTGVRSLWGPGRLRSDGADRVCVFAGSVWELFRDEAFIYAVTHVGNHAFLGVGYDGSQWAGRLHHYEERTATLTYQLGCSLRKELSSAPAT